MHKALFSKIKTFCVVLALSGGMSGCSTIYADGKLLTAVGQAKAEYCVASASDPNQPVCAKTEGGSVSKEFADLLSDALMLIPRMMAGAGKAAVGE